MSEGNINAYCKICNKGYHVCNTCKDQKAFFAWRSVTDTAEHFKIYLVLHQYAISKDKNTARNELKQCDLTGLEGFRPEVKSVINEIMTEDKIESVLENKIVSVKKKDNVKTDKVKTAVKSDNDENIE